MKCPVCGEKLPEGSHFCLSCGSPLNPSESPTLSGVEPAPPGRSAHFPSAGKSTLHPPSPSSSADFEACYVPGTTLADRYRIVALLGKGGMGEVYRAEDLKLGQTVALKFLPLSLAGNPAALERFHREVRLTRQVSHPNVCRVFDIGEADDRVFITMEYIDGEDLAALLRRIGRLPPDKGIQITRQMCAGLAVAHEHGIIHRDLKPANVMLDGRGSVRIMDFGIAGAVSETKAGEAAAGTPAYMSPEQFENRELTEQSDLYSLGLVLYEIFTGRHAFDAPNLLEMVRLREKSTPTFPFNLSRDIDPLVQSVILRCLERDPSKRPRTALEVAAALPGGDPLAAALAAGETPSPGMVAAAGQAGTLTPTWAWTLLLCVAAGLAVVTVVASHALLLDLLPQIKSPAALTERAREIARDHGHVESPVDSADWFQIDDGYWSFLRKIPAPARYRNLGSADPTPLEFLYRQSPHPLETKLPWRVTTTNPPPFYSGELTIGLDGEGQLNYFSTIAVPQDGTASANRAVDWSSFFREAGLDPQKMQQVKTEWYPNVEVDQQTTWKVERNGQTIQVRAGSYQNKPVFFEVRAPWARASRTQAATRPLPFRLAGWTFVALAIGLFVFCIFLARRNIRLGRGDKKGAIRLAVFLFGVEFVYTVLSSHYNPDILWMWQWFLVTLGMSAGFALQIWVYYIALEPYARRSCPQMLISWTRLLDGKFRDPLVGRDVLLGILFGIGMATATLLRLAFPYWFGIKGVTPGIATFSGLAGMPAFVGSLVGSLIDVLMDAVGGLAFFVVVWRLTRSRTLGIAALALALIVVSLLGENLWVEALFGSLVAALFLVCLLRVGLLAAVFAQFASIMLLTAPITPDFSRWYATWGAGVVLVVLAVAIYGFYISLGGQPMLGTAFEE